nr:cation transporting ATPase C-terminal domain-containing protein [Salinarimonas rosea]
MLGTRAVLVAIAAVALLQLVFTYAPFMNAVFATRPLGIVEGLAVLAAGILLFAALEFEKALGRRLRRGAKPT